MGYNSDNYSGNSWWDSPERGEMHAGRPPEAPGMDLGGALLLVVGAFVLLCGAAAVVLFAGLWMALHDPLRSILEISPLSGSIAETTSEDGNPFQVGAVIAGLVVVAMIVASVWRRGVVRRVLHGESPRRAVYLSSLLRTVVLFAGLGLVVTGGGIAAGADLPGNDFFVEPAGDDGGEASGGLGTALVFLLLALGAIAAYAFVSGNRVWNKMASRLGYDGSSSHVRASSI